jgi:hypothetical protein
MDDDAIGRRVGAVARAYAATGGHGAEWRRAVRALAQSAGW